MLDETINYNISLNICNYMQKQYLAELLFHDKFLLYLILVQMLNSKPQILHGSKEHESDGYIIFGHSVL